MAFFTCSGLKDGGEGLLFLANDFAADPDDSVECIAMCEREGAKPCCYVECENGFNKTFVENSQDGLVNLKFAEFAKEKEALLAF